MSRVKESVRQPGSKRMNPLHRRVTPGFNLQPSTFNFQPSTFNSSDAFSNDYHTDTVPARQILFTMSKSTCLRRSETHYGDKFYIVHDMRIPLLID